MGLPGATACVGVHQPSSVRVRACVCLHMCSHMCADGWPHAMMGALSQPELGGYRAQKHPPSLTTCGPCAALHATAASAAPIFSVSADTPTAAMGRPLDGNVLSRAVLPAGQTATVTGINVQGTSVIISPSSGGDPIPLKSPATGQLMGTLSMQASGAYSFTPMPGYVGPAPAANVYSRSSDGQTAISSLLLTVAPCEYTAHAPGIASQGAVVHCMHACMHEMMCRTRSVNRESLGHAP